MSNEMFPKRVTIELTNKCNVSCTFCHRCEFDMKIGDMTFELYKKIIDEMANHLPIAMVPFFRGESLLHPQFIEFIQYAKEKNIGPIQYTSNGLALSKELSQKIIDAGIDFVSFSLDTLDAELYKKSRLAGNLQTSMDNVKYFAKLCKEYKQKGLKVPEIQVSSVDIDLYKDGQREFVDFWKKYVDIVRIYEEHDNNGRFRNKEVSKKFEYIIDRRPCKKIYTDMVICWDGSISLCCYDWNETHNFGNLNEKSISEIWNSIEYQKLREMHENNTISEDFICYECEFWKADYLDKKVLGKIFRSEDC